MKTITDLRDIKKVNVYPYVYTVIWTPNVQEIYDLKNPKDPCEVFGWLDLNELKIYIDSNLLEHSPLKAAEIFLHEWIHAGHDYFNVDDDSTEEQYTNITAKMWLHYMKSEPEIFAYLTTLIHNSKT